MDILKLSSSWFSHMKHEKNVWSDVAAQINCGQVVPSSFSLIFTGFVCVCAFYGTRLFPTCQVGVSRLFKTGATLSPSLLLSSSPSTSSSWPCSSVCTNGLEVSDVSEAHRELHPQLGTHGPEPYRESLMQLCMRWLEHMPGRSIRNARIDANLDVRKNAK